MSEEKIGNTLCFDYSHNNTLTIESPSYADFTQFLFGSSFRLGKIQAGMTSIEKLERYRMLVIGGPRSSTFSPREIEVVVEFVKRGGSLFVIHDEGGDYGANSNLSELTEHFGFRYNNDIIFDSMNFHNKQSRIIVTEFEPHATTRNVDAIVQSSACSISINEAIEADENIKIFPLAVSSLNAFKTKWNGESWQEELDAPKSVLAVCTHYYLGRVIGLCTVSMFSSLSSSYGFFAKNNQEFIYSIFNWLIEPPDSEEGQSRDEKNISVPLNYNLYIWMEKLVNEGSWSTIADIINFAVKTLKDDYINLMVLGEEKKKKLKELRKKQLMESQNIPDVNERQQYVHMVESESNILNLGGYSVDTSKELEEIMSSLSAITNGEVGNDFSISELANKKTDLTKKKEVLSEKPKSKILEEPCLEISKLDFEDQTILSKQLRSKKISSSCEEIESNIEKIEQEIPNKTQRMSILDEIGKESKKPLQIDKSSIEQIPKQSLKARADAALDDALKSLDSFDEFTKKLQQFKALNDDDAPLN